MSLQNFQALDSSQNLIQVIQDLLPRLSPDLLGRRRQKENDMNSSMTQNETHQEDDVSEFPSLGTLIKGFSQGIYKGMKYIINHPFQTLTFALASQVPASAAFPYMPSPLSSRFAGRAIGDEFMINQNTTFNQREPLNCEPLQRQCFCGMERLSNGE